MKASVYRIVCAFCAQDHGQMKRDQAVFGDLKATVVLVEAKGGKTLDQTAIGATAIVDAGYDVVKMELSTQLVDEMRAAAKSAKK